MQLAIGDHVQVWDDDRGRWWPGEIDTLDDDEVYVIVLDGDHPLHPWEAMTITAPRDPEFIKPSPPRRA